MSLLQLPRILWKVFEVDRFVPHRSLEKLITRQYRVKDESFCVLLMLSVSAGPARDGRSNPRPNDFQQL